ncbi:MAG: glycosyltransferase family 4 protein [Smithellaceae bacterium]
MSKKQEKTIWVLSELYYPEETGSGYYITKIAEEIATRYRVCVLTVQPTYAARGTKAPKDEAHHNVFIHRCRATALNKDIVLFRLLNMLTISLSVFFNALRRIRKHDIVLVITNPPTLPLIASFVCKIRGAKMVLRLEDMYPEVLVAAKIIKADSALAQIIDAVQKNIYKRSDRILVLGRQMTELVHGKTGNGIEKISLITHWADCDEIRPLPRDRNALLSRLGIMDKFVIQYSGNMGRTHDLESLIRCAKILHQQSGIHFLFVGSGAKESWLRKSVSKLGLKNVTILSPQPRSELIMLLNACDMAIISFVKGMAGASVPSRMYNIMSAGKPILAVAEEGSELARVISEENIGWVVAPGSPELMAKAILEANANRLLLREMSVKARQAATEKYTKPLIIRKHRDLMDTYHG